MVYHTKLQSMTSNWCKFHIDLSLGSLLNGQIKKLGMARKNCIQNHLKVVTFGGKPQGVLNRVVIGWCKGNLQPEESFGLKT